MESWINSLKTKLGTDQITLINPLTKEEDTFKCSLTIPQMNNYRKRETLATTLRTVIEAS